MLGLFRPTAVLTWPRCIGPNPMAVCVWLSNIAYRCSAGLAEVLVIKSLSQDRSRITLSTWKSSKQATHSHCGTVVRADSQTMSGLPGEGSPPGNKILFLPVTGGVVRLSVHLWISERPSMKLKPHEPS